MNEQMNNLKRIAPVLIGLMLLSGCSEFKESNQRYEKFIEGKVMILIDPENGCQYVTTGSVQSGVYPRMDQEGKQICEKVE